MNEGCVRKEEMEIILKWSVRSNFYKELCGDESSHRALSLGMQRGKGCPKHLN